MRIILSRFALLSVSLSVLFGLPSNSISTPSDGPSASGSFQINLDTGAKRHIDFRASRDLNGKVTGETIFRDDISVSPSDTSTENDSTEASRPFFLKAEFDCLLIEGNKAVMSGAVTESSSEKYIGRRVLIVAQENGGPAGSPTRDKLTWGIYRNKVNDWLPGDSERPEEVSGHTWIATDSERPDDIGILSVKEKTISCQTFPLSSFSFINASEGQGSVHVRP